MWPSRLFWKLFLAFAALHLASAAAFVVVVSGWQEEYVLNETRLRLYDTAIVIRAQFEDRLSREQAPSLQTVVQKLGEEMETRITIVAADGRVLAESDRDAGDMENHLRREEVLEAARAGRAFTQRRSDSVNSPYMYCALRVGERDRPRGYIRTAAPMEVVEAKLSAIRGLIWGVALIVTAAALAITYWIVARIVRPVNTLTRAADALAAGQFGYRIDISSRDELGMLAETFNRTSEVMATREYELRESTQRLSTVLEGMLEGVIAVDQREHILLANRAAGKLLRFRPEESVGKSLLETVRHHALHQAAEQALTLGEPIHLEMETAGGKGKVLSVNARALPGTPPPGVVLVLHDVTELRRLETLRQQFVANVSHELKTPLSAIKAYAETLRGGAIDDPRHNVRFLEQIEEQADRLHQLILDMIHLARIESGQEAFEIADVPLAEVVEECLAAHHTGAEARELHLHREPSAEGVVVRADAEGLRQILDNLVDNAVKYTLAGGEIAVGWHVEDGHAILWVRDTGLGIPAEALPRVFERFFRVDKARSREVGGTGLGLSIVKHLAQSFGGSVAVESEVGRGSTFLVRLPLARVSAGHA